MMKDKSYFIEATFVAILFWTSIIWIATMGHVKLDHWIHKNFPAQAE